MEPPATLREDSSNSGPLANLFNDKESITADPVTAGYVYAVWDRIESPNNNPLTPPQAYANAPAFSGPAWFARSKNNGASWETARPIFAPYAGRTQTIGNQIVVLPDGTLVDGFVYITGANGQGIQRGDNAAVIFSSDNGTTWSSTLTVIANMGDTGNRDPEPVNCLGDNTRRPRVCWCGQAACPTSRWIPTRARRARYTRHGRRTGRRRCSGIRSTTRS